MTWMRWDLSTTGGSCQGLAVDPTDPDVVYAAGYPGFHKTTNGGGVWTEMNTGLSGNTYAVVVDAHDPAMVYTGGSNGIFKSTDSGNTWTNVGLTGVNAILIHPEDDEILYAGTQSGVYRSMNAGANWESLNEGLDDPHVTSLGVFPGCYLFCGTDIGGMYRWDISTALAEHGASAGCMLSALPNPMKHRTVVSYDLAVQDHVELKIFDIQGRLVRTIVSETQSAGIHRGYWDGIDRAGRPVAAGVYFCTLRAGTATDMLKVIVTR